MGLKAKFTSGSGAMAFDCYEYHIYDENYEYFSMIPYDLSKCINGKTILELNYSMGGQSVKIVDSIPNYIENYNKWEEDRLTDNGQAKLKK